MRINRLWNSLYSKGIITYAEAYDQAKLDTKAEDAEEEKRRIELQTRGPVRRGDPRRKGDNFGYSSRMNTNDRRHYNKGCLITDDQKGRVEIGKEIVQEDKSH